jgi:hypothetical protein
MTWYTRTQEQLLIWTLLEKKIHHICFPLHRQQAKKSKQIEGSEVKWDLHFLEIPNNAITSWQGALTCTLSINRKEVAVRIFSKYMQGVNLWRLSHLCKLLKKIISALTIIKERKRYPCYRPWRPIGLREVEAPTFLRQTANRWRKCCQPYAPATLYPPGFFFFFNITGTHFC